MSKNEYSEWNLFISQVLTVLITLFRPSAPATTLRVLRKTHFIFSPSTQSFCTKLHAGSGREGSTKPPDKFKHDITFYIKLKALFSPVSLFSCYGDSSDTRTYTHTLTHAPFDYTAYNRAPGGEEEKVC